MICDRFYTIVSQKTIVFEKTIVLEKKLLTIILTIVNEGLSLTIVKETTKLIKTVLFGKNLHANLLNVVLHEVKHLRGS